MNPISTLSQDLCVHFAVEPFYNLFDVVFLDLVPQSIWSQNQVLLIRRNVEYSNLRLVRDVRTSKIHDSILVKFLVF